MENNSTFGNGILENKEVDIFSQNALLFLEWKNFSKNDGEILKDYRAWYEKNFSKKEIELMQRALWVKDDGIVWKETMRAIVAYEKSRNLRMDGLLMRKTMEGFRNYLEQVRQTSQFHIGELQNNMQKNPFQINNPVKNEAYLRQKIPENFIKNIFQPTPQELIAILKDENFKKTQGNAYVYAVQAGLSMLGYMTNMKYIDGIFGANTRADLIEFQKSYKEKAKILEKNFWKMDVKTMQTLENVLATL